MYLVTDAYKHGNERQIMSVFSAEQDVPGSATRKVTRKFGEANLFYMMADETSMRGRHGKLQPGFKFHTVEYLHTISSKDLDVPDKPRKVFQGSTRGDTIGPIKYDAFDKAVRTTFEAKKKIYGNNIRRVGGASTLAPEEEAEPRKNTTVEPLFYHQYPKEVYREFLYSFSCRQGHGATSSCTHQSYRLIGMSRTTRAI